MTSLKRDISNIVDDIDISKTKSSLWESLIISNDISSICQQEQDLRSKLDAAFKSTVSTSILLIGPPGCGKRKLVDKVLTSYNPYSIEGDENYVEPSIGRVNGNICTQDSQALNSLADQLLIRSTTEERHFNLAVEDLEKHFKQCRIDKRPAIVILEELDLFARREKQILIYTLLDLMHKEHLLFVVIGISSCGALHMILEKRILSRLNAQYVHIPPLKDSDICKTLSKRLTKPFISNNNTSISSVKKRRIKEPINDNDDDDNYDNNNHETKDDKINTYSENKTTASISEYHDNFTSNIYGLFGEWDDDGQNTKKGVLEDMITIYVNWGRSLDFFIKVAMRAVQRLSISRPYIDQKLIETEIASMDPVTTAEMINWLPQLELYILGAVYRLEVTRTANADITIGNALNELNKIITTEKLPTRNKVIEGFLSLADLKLISISNGMAKVTTSRRITDHTFVHLINPKHEYEAAFSTKTNYSSGTIDGIDLNLGRIQPIIKMNEKLRKSILVPQQHQVFLS